MPITQISGPAVAIDGGVSLGAPLTIGTNDAQPLIFETSGTERARFTPTGELIVIGPIVTINSTVVDIADRVFTVNKSAGANDPVPSLMTGLSVYRGAVASVARDKAVIIWDEPNSRWNFCLNTGGDEITIGADQNVKLASLLASNEMKLLTNAKALIGRNFANSADIEIVEVNASDEVNIAAGGANITFGGGSFRWEGDANRTLTLHAHGTGSAELHTQTGTLSLETTTGAIEIATTNHNRSVNIATGNADQLVVVGSDHGASSLTLDAGTGGLNIGTSASARTVNIATGAAAQAVTLGSSTGASSLMLNAGTGGIGIGTSASARMVMVGTGAASQSVTLGSTDTTSSLTLNFGTSGATIASGIATSGTPTGLRFTPGAHSGLASAELTDMNVNLARTVVFTGGGTIASQRSVRIQSPTFVAGSATTMSLAAGLEVAPPVASTNVTISAVGTTTGTYAINATGNVRTTGAMYIRNGNGLTVTDASGSGIWIYQAGANIWNVLGQSGVTSMDSFVGWNAGTDLGSNNTLGTTAKRWLSSAVGTQYVKTHSSFASSETITQTGATATTDATVTTLYTSPTIPDNSSTWVEVHIAGRDTGGANRAMAVRRALVTRQAAGGATLVGAVSDEYTNNAAAWGGGVALTMATIDTTGNTFRVRVSGAAATITWTCTVRFQSVSGAA